MFEFANISGISRCSQREGVLANYNGSPYPGRDFSGEVVQVSNNASTSGWLGAEVWGTGGTLGFRSDGTFAEVSFLRHPREKYDLNCPPQNVKVPLEGLSRKPKALDHARAASITLSWICAWLAADKLAQVKQGENVLIIVS